MIKYDMTQKRTEQYQRHRYHMYHVCQLVMYKVMYNFSTWFFGKASGALTRQIYVYPCERARRDWRILHSKTLNWQELLRLAWPLPREKKDNSQDCIAKFCPSGMPT